ncbi:MAG: hypothetical protein WCV84_03290 [Patescibacteria group bacterium]
MRLNWTTYGLALVAMVAALALGCGMLDGDLPSRPAQDGGLLEGAVTCLDQEWRPCRVDSSTADRPMADTLILEATTPDAAADTSVADVMADWFVVDTSVVDSADVAIVSDTGFATDVIDAQPDRGADVPRDTSVEADVPTDRGVDARDTSTADTAADVPTEPRGADPIMVVFRREAAGQITVNPILDFNVNHPETPGIGNWSRRRCPGMDGSLTTVTCNFDPTGILGWNTVTGFPTGTRVNFLPCYNSGSATGPCVAVCPLNHSTPCPTDYQSRFTVTQGARTLSVTCADDSSSSGARLCGVTF